MADRRQVETPLYGDEPRKVREAVAVKLIDG
jgi:hypothetical protein